MKSSYSRLGDFIKEYDVRNKNGEISNLIGVSITKEFISSVANVIGTDLNNYKIIRKNVFACSLMQVSRDGGIAVSLYNEEKPSIMSPAYHLFEVKDSRLLPEYLFLIFKSVEFDRAAVFYAVGGVRGTLTWDEFTNMRIPVPSIEKQINIVREFNIISKRIDILNSINNNLTIQANAVFKKIIITESENNLINGNWKKVNINDICNIVYGKGLMTSELKNSGFTVYGGNGEIGFYDTYIYKNPVVIISCRGAASGKVHYTKPYSFVTSNSLVLEIKNELITPFEFILFSAYFTDFNSKVTGSAQPQLTIDNLNDVTICLPDKNTVDCITKIEKTYLKNINRNNYEIEKLTEVLHELLNTI